MLFFRVLLVIFILYSFGGCKSNSALFQSACIQYNFVGASYAILNSHKILKDGTYGVCKIGDTNSIKLSDRFEIASNTKAITALFAAKLVDEGKIKWSTKFFYVFPELKSECLSVYSNITLQDLLCHRAHIQPYLTLSSADSIYQFTGGITDQRKQFCAQVLSQPPVYSDSGYVYSNAGIALAASMLEKVSGKSWNDMVDEYLDKDIGIPFKIGFPVDLNKDEPCGHTLSNGKIVCYGAHSFSIAPVLYPAAGLNIDVVNYAHFMQHFMKGYEGKDNFVKAKTYKYLLTAVPKYSFGWMRKTINGKDMCYHYGNSGDFCSCVAYDLTDGLSAIVLVNYSDSNAVNDVQTLTIDLIMERLKNKII